MPSKYRKFWNSYTAHQPHIKIPVEKNSIPNNWSAVTSILGMGTQYWLSFNGYTSDDKYIPNTPKEIDHRIIHSEICKFFSTQDLMQLFTQDCNCPIKILLFSFKNILFVHPGLSFCSKWTTLDTFANIYEQFRLIIILQFYTHDFAHMYSCVLRQLNDVIFNNFRWLL